MENKLIFLDNSLLNNVHAIRINVFGAGGTGSHLMLHLARIHYALKLIGRKGLQVSLVDIDVVRESSPARAMIAPCTIGESKSASVISSVNITYGTNWRAFNGTEDLPKNCDFLITCTDTVLSRKLILEQFKDCYIYHIDIGNSSESGQIVMGRKSGKKGVKKIPGIFDLHKKLKDEDVRHSCSIFDSLSMQGLFINSLAAQLCGQMIFEFIEKRNLNYHGFYFNIDNGWAKIPIK